MSENKITFPVKLASNNPQSFGIADATEISGHRTVDTLSDLYAISDPVLSILKDGSDAVGQEWFVVSEDCKYRLDNWGNRKSIAGWTKLPKQELINTKQSTSEKDQPGGYAGLDSNGKIPIEKTYGTTATVVDVATYEKLPVAGLSGVIYYVSNTSAQYKWSGSAYVDITDGADNAKKNETSIFDCSNGTSTKYYSSLSEAINAVPVPYRTSNRIISYLSTEGSTTSAANYQYHGIDSATWADLTKWEHIPNQADLEELRSELIISNEEDSYYEQLGGVVYASGVRGGSSNFKSYFFENKNFSSVEAYVGSANTNSGDAAIAFYSNSQIGSDSYLGGVAFNGITGMAQYKADVPSDCILIVVSNRYVDYTEYNVKFFSTLKKIDERIKSLENVEDGVVQTTGTDPNVAMSQKAVSEELAKYSQEITELEEDMYGTHVEVANLSDSVTSKIGGITPTGARGGSSNYTNYYIINNDYSKVSAFVGCEKGTIFLAIAFYNSEDIISDNTIYESSFIGGASFNSSASQQLTYEANVPQDCKIIVISCRTQSFPNPTASIFGLTKGLKQQIDDKVDKIDGKGLSTNDFTDNDKAILYEIENYDDVSVASGAGADGAWAYSYGTFKQGQKIRIIMYTPSGMTLPDGVAISSTCIFISYQTTNGIYKQDLLYRQGYDYPIRKGIISEGVITIEGGDTEYIRMYAKCATTEKFGFVIQAIEENTVKKCYAPSLMIQKFNALSFDSVYTHGKSGIYTFNFLHFSDIHKNEIELKRIREFTDLYQPYLCDAINTGDSVAGLGTEDFSWYAENGSKFLNVIGNHDTATSMSGSGWTGLGKQETYNKYIAPFVADWGVVGSSGNNYYYKDYISSRNYGGVQTWVKLRLIVLDCMFYDEAQNTWLESTLADAKTNEFDVMIAIHTSPANTDPIPCTYTSINASIQPAGWASYSTNNAVQVVKDFIDNGGKFICWLGGHVHRDMMGKINSDYRQLVVLVETCSDNKVDGFDRPYIDGEFEYADAFNIIGIDTNRHLLKIFKVGYEYDGAMRRKGTFVYDYENHSIIFNG